MTHANFDQNATAPVDNHVRAAMLPTLRGKHGNAF